MSPKVTYTFKVRNPTDREIRIKGIRRSCNCTEAMLSRYQIAAGSSSDLIQPTAAKNRCEVSGRGIDQLPGHLPRESQVTRTTLMLCTLTLISLAALLGLPQGGAGRSAADETLLRAVADAYDENRAKFPFGSAEFEYRDGFAGSLVDAVAGKLRDDFTATGRYAYDDRKHVLFEKRYPIEALEATTVADANNHAGGRLDSVRLLTNGKVTLQESRSASAVKGQFAYGHVITAGTDGFERFAEFPLRLGWPSNDRDDLSAHLRMVLSGAADTSVETIDQNASKDGVKVVRIALKFPNGIVQYWVDLERGAIPLVRHDEIRGGDTFDFIFSQVGPMTGGGWLPSEQTTYLKNGRTKKLIVTRTDFTQRPTKADLRLELDTPRRIGNVAAGVSYQSRKVWDLDDLPSSSSKDVLPLAKGVANPPAALALPGVRDDRPPYFTMVGIVLAVVLLSTFAVWRFRLQR